MATTYTHFRGRNDDGNETTATWKAAEDTNWNQAVDVNFRFRSKVQNSTSAINNLDVKLQYSLNGGTFTDVSASSNVVRSSASPNLADAANLTVQLTAGTGTFIGATAFDEVNGICGGNSLDVTATGNFETEFCCQLRSADVVGGDQIRLRTINSDSGAAWTTYNVTATMFAVEAVTCAGTSTGASTADAVGLSTWKAVGSSAGAATVTGTGVTVLPCVGAAVGTSTALAVGEEGGGPAAGDGLSAGTSTALAVGLSTAKATAASAGASTAAAIARAFALGGGSSVAISTASAIAQAIAMAVASSAGLATVTGVGRNDAAPASGSHIQGMIEWSDSRRR